MSKVKKKKIIQSDYAKRLAFRKHNIGTYRTTELKFDGRETPKMCVYPLVMGYTITEEV